MTSTKTIWLLVSLLFINSITLAQKSNTNITLTGYDVEIKGDFGVFGKSLEIEQITEGLEIVTITLTHPEGAPPPEFSLNWAMPSSDIAGYWSTGSFNDKTIGPSWGPSAVHSMLAKQAPVITLFGHDDSNRLTFSASEALNTTVLSAGVMEEDGMVYNKVTFFSEKYRPLKSYEVRVRFDTRPQLYSKALCQML